MKKIRNLSIRILVITFFVYVAFTIYSNFGYDAVITTTSEPHVDTSTLIDITTTKNTQKYNPDSISLEVYNKYNVNEKIVIDNPTPFATGHYQLYLTPNFTGEYLVNLTVTQDGIDSLYHSSFNVT